MVAEKPHVDLGMAHRAAAKIGFIVQMGLARRVMKHKRTNRAVGNNRLLRLAKFLRTVPEERFNYAHWVGEDWEGNADLSCGTTACALGWATTMPEFRELGLRLVRSATGWRNAYVVMSTESTFLGEPMLAAASAFDLTSAEVTYVFCPDTYYVYELPLSPSENASAMDVADHIVRFVKWRRANDVNEARP